VTLEMLGVQPVNVLYQEAEVTQPIRSYRHCPAVVEFLTKDIIT
jgi:hypothetical protein